MTRRIEKRTSFCRIRIDDAGTPLLGLYSVQVLQNIRQKLSTIDARLAEGARRPSVNPQTDSHSPGGEVDVSNPTEPGIAPQTPEAVPPPR